MAEKARENDGGIEQINGREGETATFIKTSLVSLSLRGGGFAPRHLNRSTAFVWKMKYLFSSFKEFELLKFWRLLIILYFICSTSLMAQEIEYTVKGRVVDDNGQPLSSVVLLFPFVSHEPTLLEDTHCDDQGRFLIKEKIKKGETWYLYVSDFSATSDNSNSLIRPPFAYLNKTDKHFLGEPITFGGKTEIEVGDLKVKYWYSDVDVKFLVNDRNLTEKEWEQVWYQILDSKGRVIVGSSVASISLTLGKEVDIEKSELKLALPEGKWRIEWQKIDLSTAKVYKRILARSPYFIIKKGVQTPTVHIVSENKVRRK